MKSLITGAHGFLGTHLSAALKKRGDNVTLVPREAYTNPILLEQMIAVYQPSYIYHLAASGNMANQTDEQEILIANYFGMFNLLQATENIDYSALINVSSSSVLLDYETLYSATKAGAERLCKWHADSKNKPIATIRPFSVYGPGEAPFRFIPTVFRSCMKKEKMDLDPSPVHDWVYVEDVVQAMIDTAATITFHKGKAVNVGTRKGTSQTLKSSP
jgi:nucleoside-diphosphate-sugar epimerase